MHQSYGKLIKLTRIEKNMKQEELCEGICTPSYLSRIENDRVVADEQIYKLLLYKLGVEVKKDVIDIEQIDAQIEQWYEHFLMNKEPSINIEALKEKARSTNNETYLKFKLIYCRYLLKSNKLEEVKKYISELEKIPMLNKRLNFLFTNVMILFYYKDKQYNKAIESAEKFINLSRFDSFATPLETGKFYYDLALNFKDLYQYKDSISFTKKALDIFNEWYFLELALKCHVLLGICYNNSQKFSQALHSYEGAQRVIPFLPEKNHSYYLSIINNNIGKCYENINNYQLALHYYLNSSETEKNEDKMVNTLNIIRCYYKLGKVKDARYWLEIAKKNIQPNTSNKHLFQIKIFNVVLHDNNFPIAELKKLEEECIIFFKAENLINYIIFYCKVFAQLYKERKLYKKVSEMYELALQTIESLKMEGKGNVLIKE